MPNFLELEDGNLLVLEGNHEFYLLLEDNIIVADQVEISLPKTTFLEESVFTLTVFFRTRSSKSASTPTSIRYRIDCLRTRVRIRDWTTVSAAPNVSIVITASDNEIKEDMLSPHPTDTQEVNTGSLEAHNGLNKPLKTGLEVPPKSESNEIKGETTNAHLPIPNIMPKAYSVDEEEEVLSSHRTESDMDNDKGNDDGQTTINKNENEISK